MTQAVNRMVGLLVIITWKDVPASSYGLLRRYQDLPEEKQEKPQVVTLGLKAWIWADGHPDAQ